MLQLLHRLLNSTTITICCLSKSPSMHLISTTTVVRSSWFFTRLYPETGRSHCSDPRSSHRSSEDSLTTATSRLQKLKNVDLMDMDPSSKQFSEIPAFGAECKCKKMGSTEIVMSSIHPSVRPSIRPSVCLSVTYFSAGIEPRDLKY
jgi:hypothetical protein